MAPSVGRVGRERAGRTHSGWCLLERVSDSEYAPSPASWVRDQVDQFEGSNGADGNTLRDTGLPIIVLTMVGNKSGKIRKVPLMRVEHDGEYVAVASKGGAPENPVWYYNVKADPNLELQ